MRILQATTSRTWSGGTEQCLLLAKYMNELGHETGILTIKGSLLDEKAKMLGIKRFYFPGTEKISIKNAKKLAKLIKQYDVVNTHIPAAHWYIWCASFFCKKKPKIVYTRRVNYDVSFLSSLTKYNINTDAIIAISNEVKNRLKKRFFLRKKKISVIPDGIEIDKFSPLVNSKLREEIKIDKETIVITHVANFQKVKGHNILFDAFKRILEKRKKKKLLLLLVGRDTQSEKAQNMIKEKKIEKHVISLGFRKDIPQILKETDLFVFPSINEGLGSSLLQAMAMKKVVVASYIGGIRSYLKHMENGITVKPGNVDSLYQGLLKGLENLNNENMKENARKTAQEFDIKNVTEKTLQLYKELLK
ncbi:glycosyl transferase group 1 [Desulfurobacterium thermolithotrophum DSM 11699]|uniref:Glycosyl transferase group 1 n=1 Tax=Desulfurobacterium thermolithotrophum (strain DSM 11699 / BSA) TaxID=868864 RepID=F0S2U4_DESTD|nr:glycosyltransferase family 4 protein [Desulfurobacterium thermolithotrophum]ADY73166.1 glycosyl transferase group 1 [Desulfurobacterium thermolithotrophum DSM 11699]